MLLLAVGGGGKTEGLRFLEFLESCQLIKPAEETLLAFFPPSMHG